MNLTQYHQHSLYCDGQDSPAAVAEYARALGFAGIGFSSHAPVPFASEERINFDWTMKAERYPAYLADIAALKERYRGEMEVEVGLEIDYFNAEWNPARFTDLDYKIGSVHSVPSALSACGFMSIDSNLDAFALVAEEYGGYEGLFKRYYLSMSEMIAIGGFDIIAHFDIVTKNSIAGEFFSAVDPVYLKTAKEAMREAIAANLIIEVNTGYMARKNFAEPFPNYNLIAFGVENGAKYCLNSDCHRKEQIDFAFPFVREKLAQLGVKELWRREGGSWVAESTLDGPLVVRDEER